MENSEKEVGRWVDDHLAFLNGGFQPNVTQALARFEYQRNLEHEKRRRLGRISAAFFVVCVLLLAFPSSRNVAEHAWLPCVNMCRTLIFRTVNAMRVSAADAVIKNGQQAPDFSLKDAKGMNIRLSAYKGKVVLLDFWATWCGGCKVEIPWFIEFENKYANHGLAAIGVSMDADGWKVVRPFIEMKGINYPVVIGSEALGKRYGLGPLPMTLLIDRTGKVSFSRVGLVDKDAFEIEINQLLEK